MVLFERWKDVAQNQFGATVPKELRDSYRAYCLEKNISRLSLVAILTITIEFATLLFHALTPVEVGHLQRSYPLTSILYIAFMLFSLFLFYMLASSKIPLRRKNTVMYLAWAIFILCELISTTFEIKIYNTQFRSYAVLLILAQIPMFSRRMQLIFLSIYYFTIVLVTAIEGIPFQAMSNNADFINLTVFFVCSCALSMLNASSNIHYYVSKKFLKESNQSITHINKELTDANLELELLSHIDPLTRLTNHRFFDEYFERSWMQCERQQAPIALLILNIDHFKLFNLRFGHHEGDLCLQRIATAIRKKVNNSEGIVARYGGEEIAILYPFAPMDTLIDTAEGLRSAIEDLAIANPDSTNNPNITISIGLSCRYPNELSRNDLEILAVTAMGQAKSQGRNRVVADIDAAKESFVAPRGSALQAPGAGEDLTKLRTILQSTTICTFSVDLSTKEFDFSPEILTYTSLPNLHFASFEELLSYICPEDHDLFLQALGTTDPELFNFNNNSFRILCTDGNYCHVSAKTRIINDEFGNPKEIIGSLTDISVQMHSQQIARLMADGAANYLYQFDFQHNKLWMSETLCQDLNITVDDENPWDSFLSIIHPDDYPLMTEKFFQIVRNETDVFIGEFRCLRPNGDILYLNVRGLVNRNPDGTPHLFAGTGVDITTQVHTRQINDLIIDGCSDCVYIFDFKKDTLQFSPKIMQITSLEALSFDHAMQTWTEHILPEDREHFHASMRPMLSGLADAYAAEFRVIGPDDTPLWVAVRGKVARDEHGLLLMMAGSIFNVSSMGQYNTHIEKKSTTDAVTMLPNRIAFYKELGSVLRDQLAHGFIIMIDVDDFGNVNNMHGLSVGDETLRRFASYLLSVLPKNAMLYHLGEDVFVVNFPDANIEAATGWMNNLYKQDGINFMIEEQDIFFTYSTSAVEYACNDEVDELLTDAGIALSHVKYSGKAKYMIFSPDDRVVYLQRLEMENELRHAVDNDFVGFQLYYQPLIDAKTMECIGAEALLRWRKMDGSMISPLELITCLENIALMPKVESWVLRTAFAQCRTFVDNGMRSDFVMNINLTPAQISKRTLLFEVLSLLDQYRLRPANIVLEITEAACVLEMQGSIHILQSLKDHDIVIAIDDFGTGYSSLSYLRQLPVSSIKVDKAFVDDIATDPEGASFVASIINLAHSIGYDVVVEGIESLIQKDILLDIKADIFQGYYFGKPMPHHEFEKKYALENIG